MENAEISLRACSGCAGDYEDPDRSAWEDDLDAPDVQANDQPDGNPQQEVQDDSNPDA